MLAGPAPPRAEGARSGVLWGGLWPGCRWPGLVPRTDPRCGVGLARTVRLALSSDTGRGRAWAQPCLALGPLPVSIFLGSPRERRSEVIGAAAGSRASLAKVLPALGRGSRSALGHFPCERGRGSRVRHTCPTRGSPAHGRTRPHAHTCGTQPYVTRLHTCAYTACSHRHGMHTSSHTVTRVTIRTQHLLPSHGCVHMNKSHRHSRETSSRAPVCRHMRVYPRTHRLVGHAHST